MNEVNIKKKIRKATSNVEMEKDIKKEKDGQLNTETFQETVNEPSDKKMIKLTTENVPHKQKDDNQNGYITQHVSKHGKVTYDIDVVTLAERICEEYLIINNSTMLAMYDAEKGIWLQHAEAYLKSVITKKIKEAFNISARNTTLELIKDTTYIHGNNIEFNKKYNAVVFKNGTYYFPENPKDKQGNWIEVFDPEDCSTTRIPHAFNVKLFESSKKPVLTMEALLPFMGVQEMQMIFEYLGSCFYKRQNPRGILTMTGDGKNGKSRIIEMFQYFIGKENSHAASLKSLVENRFSKSALLNKHLNACGDIDADFFRNSAELKGITGGDQIFAEFKGENGFTFENFARLLFSANKLPRFKDDTESISSRMLFLSMPNKPRQEDVDKLVEAYHKESELIIVYCIKSFIKVLENQKFTESEKSLELKQEWSLSSNNVSEFANECCKFDSQYSYPIRKTYEAYKIFCSQNGFEACNSRTFKERFLKFVEGEKKTNKTNVYLGVSVYDPTEE